MSTDDFTGRPLVADSIVGVREFDVDSLGRLRGVTHAHIWTPGENEAKCASGIATSLTVAAQRLTAAMRYSYGGYVSGPGASVPDPEPPTERKVPPTHQVAGIDCNCGFYAYTDDDDRAWVSDDRVTGIIRGAGVATVGSRGFRVERAEIVALVDPSRRSAGIARRWDELSTWAERNAPLAIAMGATGFVGGAFLTVGLAVNISAWFALLAVFPIAAASLAPASFHGVDIKYDRRRKPTVDMDLVRRNYPDVPCYPSTAAAIKAHPLSTPPPPHVPSPDDEDFWSRSA